MAFRDRRVATIRAALPVFETANSDDLEELDQAYRRLRSELRQVVRSNLTILSLLAPRDGSRTLARGARTSRRCFAASRRRVPLLRDPLT